MKKGRYTTASLRKEDVQQNWWVIDAQDQVLGRLAAQVATLIRGKHKASYTPHVNCGDKVVIINAEKVRLTGNKMTQREHLRHTGYPGGQRSATPEFILNSATPTKLVEQAVKGMLPKNKLANDLYRNLHVYVGSEHPHSAQEPKAYELKY